VKWGGFSVEKKNQEIVLLESLKEQKNKRKRNWQSPCVLFFSFLSPSFFPFSAWLFPFSPPPSPPLSVCSLGLFLSVFYFFLPFLFFWGGFWKTGGGAEVKKRTYCN
jgi:hypothetical protein